MKGEGVRGRVGEGGEAGGVRKRGKEKGEGGRGEGGEREMEGERGCGLV